MHTLLPAETALVLGGGGAKGAYEIGIIEGLEHMGIRANMVYGTSIGSLNAAMYALGDYEAARTLWENIRLDDLVTPQSMALAEEAESMFSRPDKILDFITRNAQKKGVDPTPLFDLIQSSVSEEALRSSPVRFGLVTTRFPTMTQIEKPLEDMKPGSLHDWLMASCACFPAFPMRHIDGDRYIDGGFSDNVPVNMAIRAGAKHIIAIDIGRHRTHHQFDRRPNVTYIRTAHSLGGLLNFDTERSKRNMQLGYHDALRAFGYMRGVQYSFDPDDAQHYRALARQFVSFLTLYEANLTSRNAAPLFSLLEEGLPPQTDEIDYLLRAMELCAITLELDPTPVYTFDTMRNAIQAALPMEQAQSMLGSLLGGRIGVLFAPPQPDRKVVLACLYHLLKREGAFPSLALHTLSVFPRELLCTLTLREILL